MAPDGSLAASSTDGDLSVWNARKWTKQWTTKSSPPKPFTSISFSPDSALLAVASGDTGPSCEVWDVWTEKRTHRFKGHAQEVTALQFSPDRSLLASASDDATIRLWDLRVAESPRNDTITTGLALSPLGTMFATSSPDGAIEVRRVGSDELAWSSRVEHSDIPSLAMVISPGDKFLALHGPSDAAVRVLDLQSGQPYASIEHTMARSIRHVSFRSDCGQVVFVGWGGEAELWDMGSRTRVWNSYWEVGQFDDCVRVAFSPRNDLVAWLTESFLGLLDTIVIRDRSTVSEWTQKTVII